VSIFSSQGVELIATERTRQIEREGWTPEHDAEHVDGELVSAAISYAIHPSRNSPPITWPWDDEWWKPSPSRVRDLVKAGALIAAEIDRLIRSGEVERSVSRRELLDYCANADHPGFGSRAANSQKEPT